MNKVKRALPFLAVFSIVAYVCALMVQFGYYSEFQIDVLLLTPRFDPASLLTIAIVAIFILFAIGQLKLMSFLRHTPRFLPAFITDLIVLLTLIYSFYKPGALQPEEIGIDLHLNVLYSAILAVIISIRIKVAVNKRRRGTERWKQIYIDTSFWKIDTSIGESATPKMTIHWMGAVLIGFLINIVVPYAVGSSFALARTEYTEVVSLDRTDKIQIVIGQTSDGYIVKSYDEKQKRFDNGWFIVKGDSLEFQGKSIASLESQKLIITRIAPKGH